MQPLELISLGALIAAICCQIAAIVLLRLRFPSFSRLHSESFTDKLETIQRPVSIIIASRNRLDLLKKCLPILLTQDYSVYEVVIVDCASELPYLTTNFQGFTGSERIKLYRIEMQDFQGGLNPKKIALQKGISETQYQQLVFVDDDGIPASNQWLRHMAGAMNFNADVVVGLSPYAGTSGGFVSIDTAFTARLMVGSLLQNRPYMALGRNWGYTRTFFKEAAGFGNDAAIWGGDDDLLIQKAEPRHRIATVTDPNAWVISQPVNGIVSWFKQKRRHLSVARHYKNRWVAPVMELWTLLTLAYALLLMSAIIGLLQMNRLTWSISFIALLLHGVWVSQFDMLEKKPHALTRLQAYFVWPFYLLAMGIIKISLWLKPKGAKW